MLIALYSDLWTVITGYLSMLMSMDLGPFALGDWLIALSVVSIVLGFVFRRLTVNSSGGVVTDTIRRTKSDG